MNQDLDLSIVLPAYNEENRIGPTLDKIEEYLSNKEYSYEILVVDDGSTDETAALIRKRADKNPHLHLISNPGNQGKGYAVRNGVLHTRGKLVLFSDSDLSTPIGELDKLLYRLYTGVDVAIGSRHLEGSDIQVPQPWQRVWMGRIFNALVRILFGTSIQDTQCGFKLFRGDVARALFSFATINRFGFDVEIIFLAKKMGYKVEEVPIIWINDEETKVSAIKDSLNMFMDLLRIRCKMRR